MDRTRVYVAGPYNSDPESNTEVAIAVGQMLLDAGYAPFVPHLSHFWHLRYENDHATWMALDLPWVAQADLVVRIPGASAGADEEIALAHALKIPIVDLCGGAPCDICLANVLETVPPEQNSLKIPAPVANALVLIGEVFGKKNADYAADNAWRSNFTDVASQMGFTDLDACDVLIAVKQARLKSLRANGRTPVNEAIADTYLDRAVYAVIALAMLIEDGAPL